MREYTPWRAILLLLSRDSELDATLLKVLLRESLLGGDDEEKEVEEEEDEEEDDGAVP